MKKVARDDHTRVRRIVGLMIFVAATLAVAGSNPVVRSKISPL